MRKKLILFMLVIVMILGGTLSSAYTRNNELRVYGFHIFTWSAYANASFYMDDGKFAGHGPLTKINIPGDTSSYSYAVWSVGVGNTDYRAIQEVTNSRRNLIEGIVDSRTETWYINSPGSMK